MNVIDIILSIFLLLGFVRGFFKGFLLELAGLLALFIGVYAALQFSDYTVEFLQNFLDWEPQYIFLMGFALTFFLIVLAISLLGKALTKLVNVIALGLVNKLLGAVFGLLKMAFLASLFFMLMHATDAFSIAKTYTDNSILYRPVTKMAPMLLPGILHKIETYNLLENPWEEEDQTSS